MTNKYISSSVGKLLYSCPTLVKDILFKMPPTPSSNVTVAYERLPELPIISLFESAIK
jgi:hypothetical protein